MSKLPVPKFNLRVSKATSPTLISLVFRYRGKKLVYSTGSSIHPQDWDFNAQRPIIQQRRPELLRVKRMLEDLAFHCTNIYIESDYGQIELTKFKELLDIKMGKKLSSTSSNGNDEIAQLPSFLEYLSLELEEMKKQGMRHSSWKGFNRHANILIRFAEETTHFDYNDVDWNFRLRLIDWLGKQNHKLAYGNKTLSTLRQFLERARRKKLHTNVDYQGSGWLVSPKKAKGEKVILNPAELQKIADLRLSGIRERVRDLFLIGAGTGQRFSDYSKYQPDNFYKTFNNITILSIISQKTETPAKVPLNLFPWLVPVLEKYEYHSPKVSMQKLNVHIKDICEMAKIESTVFVVNQYIGRKPRVEKTYVPKAQEVSSHTCRRSFATNVYRMGYRLSQIMPMTGHSTESQLREYIGIDAEENAETIALEIMHQRKSGSSRS